MAKPKAIQWLEEQTGLAERLAADVAEVRRRLAG